jgi:hypothetical protein
MRGPPCAVMVVEPQTTTPSAPALYGDLGRQGHSRSARPTEGNFC